MTAAAAAATAGAEWGTSAALGLVVAGGLVEGWALGWFQSRVLRVLASGLDQRRYVLATVLVAGLGWAAASAPAALASDGDDRQPALLVVAGAAAALGLAAGVVLGIAQAAALRGAVRHPWRWVGANAAGWPGAMVVVFVGATTPSASWPTWAILVLGAVTGAAAGGLLGVVSGWFLPSLDGPSSTNRVVLALLASRHGTPARRSLLGLQVRGRRSGRWYPLPVQYAASAAGLTVLPGHAEHKTWWRNIGSEPTPVLVLREGAWTQASARVLVPGDSAYETVRAAYQARWPRSVPPADQPAVLIQLGGPRPVD